MLYINMPIIVPSLICKVVDINKVDIKQNATETKSSENLTLENSKSLTLATADEKPSGGMIMVSIVTKKELARAAKLLPITKKIILNQYWSKLNCNILYKKKFTT